MGNSFRFERMNPQATRDRRTRRFCLPFFSMSVITTEPISPVRRTCVPPQGWRSMPVDLDEAHAARSARRLHRHGLHQPRIGIELLVGDPALGHGCVAGDQRIQLLGDLGLVEAGIRNVEIEPPVAVADGAAGDRVGQDDAQEMKRRVDAHALEPPRPVELERDGLALRQARGGLRADEMCDLRTIGAVDRVRDLRFALPST